MLRLMFVGLFASTLACSGKAGPDDTAGQTSTTEAQTGGSGEGTATSGTPSGSSSDASTSGTSGSGASATSSGPPTTGGESTGCGGVIGCGISVEGPSAVCDEGDPVGASTGGTTGGDTPALMASAIGGGKVEVTELAHGATCCVTLTPELSVEGATIDVSYAESGEPCDCICSYTIHFTLVDVPVGAWTIVSGALSVDVDVT